ncbi:MAG: class I SAM-dependent methyltransferase, partial [Chloroflexi bacterium]
MCCAPSPPRRACPPPPPLVRSVSTTSSRCSAPLPEPSVALDQHHPQLMYARSARIYDLLYTGTRIKDYATEADVLHALIQRVHPGARTLLDVACGTGAHLACLRERYDVAGTDVSPEMLAVARERLGDDVPLEVADMRTLHLGRRFDAVTCLFSSIGYVLDSDGLRQTMRRFADHLNVGGV